jgi:hypothetical protein
MDVVEYMSSLELVKIFLKNFQAGWDAEPQQAGSARGAGIDATAEQGIMAV